MEVRTCLKDLANVIADFVIDKGITQEEFSYIADNIKDFYFRNATVKKNQPCGDKIDS